MSEKTLYQRIADVQGALDDLEPTGRNQFSAAALSINDIEGALRKALADAGVVTRWSYVELAQIEQGLWRSHLKVTVANVDDPKDVFEDEWMDIGGNPMAATSCARKGYLKALFHITESDDESGQTVTRTAPQGNPAQATNGGTAPLCKACEARGFVSRQGKPPRLFVSPRGNLQCNGVDDENAYCNHGPVMAVDPAEVPF